MALSILDGNQTATTLATTVSGSAHYPNHIIASGAVTANVGNVAQSMPLGVTVTIPSSAVRIGWADEEQFYGVGTDSYGSPLPIQILLGNSIGDRVTTANPLPISGTVTANVYGVTGSPLGISGMVSVGNVIPGLADGDGTTFGIDRTFPISGTVTIGNSVTIGALPVLLSTTTIGGTARLNVTLSSATTPGATAPSYANLYGGTDGTNLRAISVDTSGRTVVTGTVSLATIPALVAGTAQIGSVTASISNTVVTSYTAQGTSVTNTTFTSTTASTSLVSAVAGRDCLTVFNEGAGNLHISPGATCTTISYQVRLSSGDYWECPAGQLSLAHTAVFATAGTARVTEVS